MTTLMYLCLAAPVVVTVLVDICRSRRHQHRPKVDQVTVELHAIRRRFDVAWFNLQLGRDAADARRRMNAELRTLEDRERL